MKPKDKPGEIEKKWQKFWEDEKIFAAKEKGENNFYCLIEFPYPSADGLHVGHLRSYTALDVIARKKRMEGKNVLFPIGFDAFGLPTENYALKVKRKPQEITRENILNFTCQLKSMGFSFDWERCVDTSDPKYYKWTQWLFLKLYEAGLVYQKEMPINWCPACKTGLANEEVIGGKCERCGADVTKKNQKQWLFKITKYADRLINDLDKVDYLPKIKKQQIDWIGKSEGAEIKFKIQSTKSKTNSNNKIQNSKRELKVFTTRPDTLYGVTYMVLSPEHKLVEKLKERIENYSEVKKYIKEAGKKSDLERTESKEKTGVELKGIKAINPVNQEEIPVWVADYVLNSYGTGAIMAVPGHDERDNEFAKKYDLPIINVIEPVTGQVRENEEKRKRIVAVVHDKKFNKLLLLDWGKKYGGHLHVGGGIEEGEDAVEAAKREVQEETGYKNLKFINTSEKVHHHYIAFNKGKNRNSETVGVYFELLGDEQAEQKLSEVEKDRFKVKWLDVKKADNNITDEMHHYFLDKFIYGKCFTEEGIAVNSGKYDGLSTEEFKKKITKWLEKNNHGKSAVNYKLRDWIFSRQHYWGEPIPLIHCETCAKKYKQTFLIIHGIEGHSQENWFPWFKKTLKELGHEVIIPTLPNANRPKLSEWLEDLKKLKPKLSDNLVIIGHSLGAPVACKFIEEENLSVKKLFLVAPTGKAQNSRALAKDGLSAEQIKDIFEINNVKFDWGKLNDLISHSFIYLSDNDPYIPLGVKNNYKNLKAEVKIFKNKGHFNETSGMTEFPEILEDIEPMTVGIVPVPEKDLPVTLPEVKNYEPSDTGESPLAKIDEWVKVKCPKCGGKAKRETDTMPNWAGSNWYFIRYTDPYNDKEFASKKSIKHWLPVDLYNGGMEHTTLHLLYSRFWYKALYDLKLVPTDEPYKRRVSHGMVLAEDGQKMSKSRGNVINPDEVVKEFGADAVRLYEMFMGPFDQAINWSTDGLQGMFRFLDRINKVFGNIFSIKDNLKEKKSKLIHKTIKKVSEDIENMRFNTAISSMMEYFNERDFASKINEHGELEGDGVDVEAIQKFLIILSSFAPHLAEELWEKLGHKQSIFKEKWPAYDPRLVKDEEIEFVVQVNGKVRDRMKLPADISEDEAREKALNSEKVKKFLKGEPKKVIFVKGKLINFVV